MRCDFDTGERHLLSTVMRHFLSSATKQVLFFALGFLLLGYVASPKLKAAELKPETVQAWDQYVRLTEETLKSRLNAGNFLWIDNHPALKSSVIQGELTVVPILKRGSVPVSDGLIHHWIGVAFIPDTTLEEVIKITRDYGRYKEFFHPEVMESQALGQSGEDDRFSLRWATKVLFVSAGVDTECISRNIRVNDRTFYQTSSTTRVQEIQNFGKPNERRMEPDQGDGYIWRLFTITRYQVRDGGVFLELEALALTRDIPGSLRMFVGPVVRKMSSNSLLLSLKQTREAVQANKSSIAIAHGNSIARTLDASRGY